MNGPHIQSTLVIDMYLSIWSVTYVSSTKFEWTWGIIALYSIGFICMTQNVRTLLFKVEYLLASYWKPFDVILLRK